MNPVNSVNPADTKLTAPFSHLHTCRDVLPEVCHQLSMLPSLHCFRCCYHCFRCFCRCAKSLPFCRGCPTFTLAQVHQPHMTSAVIKKLSEGYIHVPKHRLTSAGYHSTAEQIYVFFLSDATLVTNCTSSTHSLTADMETLVADRANH